MPIFRLKLNYKSWFQFKKIKEKDILIFIKRDSINKIISD